MAQPLTVTLLVTQTDPAAWVQSRPILDNGTGGRTAETVTGVLDYP